MRNTTSRLTKKHLKKNERDLLELFANWEQEYPDVLVVVEGKRDEKVLRKLGVTGEIIRVHRGKNITETVELIETKSHTLRGVLLLTDFDAEGVKLCKRIEKQLEIKHVAVLRKLRLRIKALMANLRCIEELVVLIRKNERPIL